MIWPRQQIKSEPMGYLLGTSHNVYQICIRLLDGDLNVILANSSDYGHSIFLQIVKLLKISKHSSYFGLYYLMDDATKEWVNLNLPLVPQLKKSVVAENLSVNSDLTATLSKDKKLSSFSFLSKSKNKSFKKRFLLYFAVKYFPTDPTYISDVATRYLLFLQIRADLLSGRLQVDEETYIKLCALILQSDCGDYFGCNLQDPIRTRLGLTTISTFLEGKIRKAYLSLQGRTPALVEYQLLDQLKHHPSYGSFRYSILFSKTHTYCFYSIVPRGISIESTVVPLIFFKWSEIVAFDRKNTKIILKAKIDNNDLEYKFDAGQKHLAKSIVNLSQDHLFYRRVNRESFPQEPPSTVLPPNPYSVITEPGRNPHKTVTVRSYETDASEQSHFSVRTDPLEPFRERQLMHKELDLRARRSCRPPMEPRPRDYGIIKPAIPPRSRSRETYERRYSLEPVIGRQNVPQQAPKSIYLSTVEPAAMSQSVHFKMPEFIDSSESELDPSGEFSGGAKSDFFAYRRSFHHRVKGPSGFADYMALPMTKSYVKIRPRVLNPKTPKEEIRFAPEPSPAAAYSSEDSGHGDSTRARLDEDYNDLEIEKVKTSPSKETIVQGVCNSPFKDHNNNKLVV